MIPSPGSFWTPTVSSMPQPPLKTTWPHGAITSHQPNISQAPFHSSSSSTICLVLGALIHLHLHRHLRYPDCAVLPTGTHWSTTSPPYPAFTPCSQLDRARSIHSLISAPPLPLPPLVHQATTTISVIANNECLFHHPHFSHGPPTVISPPLLPTPSSGPISLYGWLSF